MLLYLSKWIDSIGMASSWQSHYNHDIFHDNRELAVPFLSGQFPWQSSWCYHGFFHGLITVFCMAIKMAVSLQSWHFAWQASWQSHYNHDILHVCFYCVTGKKNDVYYLQYMMSGFEPGTLRLLSTLSYVNMSQLIVLWRGSWACIRKCEGRRRRAEYWSNSKSFITHGEYSQKLTQVT